MRLVVKQSGAQKPLLAEHTTIQTKIMPKVITRYKTNKVFVEYA